MSKSKKKANKAKQSTKGLMIEPYESRRPVSGKPKDRFVLQDRGFPDFLNDKKVWVSKTEPIGESEDPKLAMQFTAKVLNETVWDWQLFYKAVPVTEHASEIKRCKKQRRKSPRR